MPKVLMMPDYRHDNPYQFLLAKELRSQSIDIIFSSDYRRVFPLFRAVKDNSANVLHLHWLTPYLKGEIWLSRLIYSFKLIIDLWLIQLSGGKIIWTVHNHLSHNTEFPRLDFWVRKRIFQTVDQIIVHNYSSAEYLQQTWKTNSKPSVIPHGHYREVYHPAIPQRFARKQLNLPLDGLIYLNLGMIRPYKGIEPLLQVWQSDRAMLHPHTLLIAGKPLDETYKGKITTLTAKAEGIIFQPNFIPSEQMHLYFSAADVVVLPFTSILTSGSLILAMSYDKPIIAPRQGGLAETLKGADSLLYDPRDRQELSKALKASTTMDLGELGKRVKTAGDRLNWHKIAQQTAQLYSN